MSILAKHTDPSVQVTTSSIQVMPDPKDMHVPELVVASDILRAKFSAKGDSLAVAAIDINEQFDGMGGFNKDSLSRALWAGYDKGVKTIGLALQSFYLLCQFYDVDRKWLVKRMGEERLRRWLFAELAKKELSVNDFATPLAPILSEAEYATLSGWLAGTGYEGNLDDDYYIALHLACKKVGIQTTPGNLQERVASVLD
jgi:hypothetical protein